jgi:hypothetical protein
VGKLVHEALRRWRFPDANFEDYLRPFALEAGFTDRREIRAAIQESRRLLERLRNHPIFNEIDSAERRHEIPYFLPEERGVIELLYRTESELSCANSPPISASNWLISSSFFTITSKRYESLPMHFHHNKDPYPGRAKRILGLSIRLQDHPSCVP